MFFKPSLAFFLILLLFNLSWAQYIPIYVESSQGLGTPSLDGGRTELELADINGDGNLDILSIGDHGSPFVNTQEHGVMVWFGNGSGNWSVSQNGNFGYGGIAVGDVNNDGFLDVGYAMHHNYSSSDFGNQLIEVALGDGSGLNWTAWDDGLATNGESYGMFGTDFADIDNDGDLDIGANSFGASAGVHIYANQEDGTWVQTFGFVGGNADEDFVFGDVNNDGFPDAAVAQQNGTVYLNDETGNFVLALSGYRYGPDLGDIDNDGTDELSFVNNNGGVEVWKWSDGNVWTSVSNGLPSSGGYEATQIYDMNIDGLMDVAAFGSGIVTVWLGDGAGNWAQATQFTLSSPGYYRAFRIDGDADHNGYPDIALVDEEGTWISYKNHLRFFKENSPSDLLTIFPVSPGPNKFVHIGSVQTIKWLSEVNEGDDSWVKLEVSKNDTLGPWYLIGDELPNNGHHQWIVPDSLESDQICRIRYTVSTQTENMSTYSLQGFYIGVQPPVPVELTSFTATVERNAVSLNWQTGTETNNSGFEIQKRQTSNVNSQMEWQPVGFVPGFGNTTEPKSYSFTDENLFAGVYQYRLKQIDFDGTFEYSNTIDVEIASPIEFSLEQNYPNPFNPSTKISYSIPHKSLVTLRIYDPLGSMVSELVNEEKEAGKYGVDFNASDLSSGVYFYQLKVGEFISVKKMLMIK